MNIIHDMNTEQFADSPVVFGGAINQNRRNLNVEIDRIRKKMEMGADFFFTQPVFTEKGVNLLRQIKEETGARILCGVMPFVSRRNAVFMKNEMTGRGKTIEFESIPLSVICDMSSFCLFLKNVILIGNRKKIP